MGYNWLLIIWKENRKDGADYTGEYKTIDALLIDLKELIREHTGLIEIKSIPDR